jgi:hypothetical protein
MTPDQKYRVEITIAFTVDITADSPEDALEQAQHCCVNDGDPDTLSQRVWSMDDLDRLLIDNA